MNVCTSGARIHGLVEHHDPCGHVLRIVGYTARHNLPVEACPRCDAIDRMKTSA